MNLAKTLGIGLACAAAAALGSVASAGPISAEFGPNLVTNGGFEATSVIAGSGWTPSGFIGEGFDYFIDTNPADAQTGTHSFAGGGIGAPGFISQTLATNPGSHYNIDLWLANLSGFADGTAIQVLWGGNTRLFGKRHPRVRLSPNCHRPRRNVCKHGAIDRTAGRQFLSQRGHYFGASGRARAGYPGVAAGRFGRGGFLEKESWFD